MFELGESPKTGPIFSVLLMFRKVHPEVSGLVFAFLFFFF